MATSARTRPAQEHPQRQRHQHHFGRQRHRQAEPLHPLAGLAHAPARSAGGWSAGPRPPPPPAPPPPARREVGRAARRRRPPRQADPVAGDDEAPVRGAGGAPVGQDDDQVHGDGGQLVDRQGPRRAGRPWCSRPPWPPPPSRPGRRPAPPGRGAPAVAGSPAASRRRATRLRPRCAPPGAVRAPRQGGPGQRRSAAAPTRAAATGHRAAVPARGNGRRPVEPPRWWRSRRPAGSAPAGDVTATGPTRHRLGRSASSPLGAATPAGGADSRPGRRACGRCGRRPPATPGRGSRAGSPGRRRAAAGTAPAPPPALGVERTRRLVGQHQRRLVGERPGDGQALALAARQHAGRVPGLVGQAQQVEQVAPAVSALRCPTRR